MRMKAASAGTVRAENRVEFKKKKKIVHFTLKDVTDCIKGKIEDKKRRTGT